MIEIAGRKLGPGQPAFIIGEVAQAHDGSLGMAHAYIDAIANAGADAVKFQTHIAAAESTPWEQFRSTSGYLQETKAEFWQRVGFSETQWGGLAEHAAERGLVFLSSAFSVEAVELLSRVGVPAWKVASGEVSNYQMLEKMAATGLPILLSAGMSDWAESDELVAFIQRLGAPLALFQCTTAYPCPPEKVGLNNMTELRRRYDVPVGLSDHTGTIYPSLAAVTLGANMLEVHITMSREMYGTSVAASLTTAELAQLVQGVRFIETMLANPVDRDQLAEELAPLRDVFFRSVVPTTDLPAGTVLAEGHLTSKKPGTGYPASRWRQLIGRQLQRDVAKDDLISEDDLVPQA